MRRSDKYFLTVMLGSLVLLALSTFGVMDVSLDVLQDAWLCSLALPLCVPRMARALDMTPHLWKSMCSMAAFLTGRRGA